MIRLPAAAFALALAAIPLTVAPVKSVAAVGALGLLLAGTGLVGLWRWPLTAAACVFSIEYTLALSVARAPVNVGGAATFGLAVLLLLASVELGRGLRRASVDARVIRSQITAWLGLATATLGATLLGLALAASLVTSIPFAAAPFVAALAALGVILALASLVGGRGRVSGQSS